MEREIIQYDSKGKWPYNWTEFKIVQENKGYYDSEKGFLDIEMVLQRKSDGKFFTFGFTDFGRGMSSLEEESIVDLEEVFPKKIEITVYE